MPETLDEALKRIDRMPATEFSPKVKNELKEVIKLIHGYKNAVKENHFILAKQSAKRISDKLKSIGWKFVSREWKLVYNAKSLKEMADLYEQRSQLADAADTLRAKAKRKRELQWKARTKKLFGERILKWFSPRQAKILK